MPRIRTRHLICGWSVLVVGVSALCLAGAVVGVASPVRAAPRPLPDTTEGIHVFNDQLLNLTPGRIAFAVSHYAGTQKMTRADADALRAVDPDFVILHYRLALGLGYRATAGACSPTGEYIYIIDTSWVREWPDDATLQDSWFYLVDGSRVYGCGWGWYLVDLDDPAWRTWWSDAVLGQLAANDDDGLFADTFSVPNYLGGDTFDPPLPAYDPAFEAEWTARMERFMTYLQGRLGGNYYLIPNVGQWVTSRDTVDYSLADGVMIEGFGYDTLAAFGADDWKLQLDRVLGLVRLGRAVLGQAYEVDNVNDRLFTLGSYLLVKGTRTYVNLDTGLTPEWWPEYEIPIGTPTTPLPTRIDDLYDAPYGVHVREYTNGRVLVNSGNSARSVPLGETLYRADPSGGGTVPSSGVLPSSWMVNYTAVSTVVVPARGAVIVVRDPTGTSPSATPAPTATATPTVPPTATRTPTPLPAATIGGTIRYHATDAPVPDTGVALTGPTSTTVTTDAAGAYTASAVTGDTWTLTPEKTGGAVDAVSALDAVYVLQAAVGLRVFDAMQTLACDVSGNGALSSYDAALILQYVVGLLPRLPVAERCASDWAFVPNPAPAPNQRTISPVNTTTTCQRGAIAYEPLAGSVAAQDFRAVLYGDCTGNWQPPAATPTATATASPSPTVTRTATPTASGTDTPTATPTFVGTPGASVVTERWGAHSSATHIGTAMDMSLNELQPTWSANNGSTIIVGEPTGGRHWGLVRFDLGALGSTTVVRSARLRLALFAHSEPRDLWLPAYPVVDPDGRGLWSESAATFAQRRPGVPWSAQGNLATSVGAEVGRAYVGNLPQWNTTWVEWDVTDAVRQWVINPAANQGLALPAPSGALFESASRENGDASTRPYLEIAYEGPNPNRPAQVTGAGATHRSGQTFVTWNEQSAGGAEVRYRVYRSTQPIDAATIDQATLLAEVEPDSGAYVHETSGCSNGSGCSPIGQQRFVIADDGSPLPVGVGLFVHTVHDGGPGYYAVTRVVDGNENRDDFGANRVDALPEGEATPRPVRVWTNATGTGWVFTQFMDHAVWNAQVEGYAYNFYVGVPAGYSAAGPAWPLMMQLHAYTGTYRLPASPGTGGTDYGWPIVQVFPDDRTNTWWFGFGANAAHVDRRLADAPVVDYTHRRLDAILDFVAGNWNVDANRQYLFGGSMGGSGTVNYGLRRGDRFAAIYAESAMTDFAQAGAAGGTAWETGGITALWGTRAQALPTTHGMSVWDWYDLQSWVSANPAAALPFLADHHGRNDDVIDWETQGAPWYPALEAGRHGMVGVFDASGHSWPGFVADSTVFQLTDFAFRRDESFPAFSRAANSDDPAVTTGCRNCRLEWSSSWLDFAGPPLDMPARYEIVLRTTNGANTTVDVTPRRLQQFVVAAGASYAWEHRRLADDALLGGGTAVADGDGLLTVSDVPVLAAGTRLVIVPAGG
ncbi:putative glycoside hydrolase [Candidatus Binatia bacterium]|nr:putative glycoside hydrolase [Candidatus Binatia bacterium]